MRFYILARYGSLPKKNHLLDTQNKERKYFDSGDFALSKATDDRVTGHQKTGKEHPDSASISHLSSPVPSDSNLQINADASGDRTIIDPVKEQSSPLSTSQNQPNETETSKLAT